MDVRQPSIHWWERPWFLVALALVAIVPLLYPQVPPLVDLLGHMGRYRVQLDLAHSPDLQRYFEFDWHLIGNLGVDLLIVPLAKLFGLELAAKLIAMAIPPLTVAGFLWVAREVHGRLPPTVLFALPFAIGHPFLFGFLNFTLAMALAFLAFGLWLRLGRFGRTKLRALLFVPISFILFVTHTFGWGTLGLLAFSSEAVRQHDRGISWWKAGLRAALHAAVMTLPMAFMLLWRSGTGGQMTFGWFDWQRKWEWLYSALRDRWAVVDIAILVVIGLALVFALLSRRLTFSRNLAFSAMILFGAFLLVPWTIFGSAYADMRLVPYMMACALLAIRFRSEKVIRTGSVLALLGLSFYLVRIAATTISLALAANDQAVKLKALDHVPTGARLVTLVGQDCGDLWALPRNTHLGAMAIVRRHAFSNDQWAIEGANLLSVRYPQAGHFRADPSQIVRSPACATSQIWSADRALRAIPRHAFDYVWLIDLPPHDPRLLDGMTPIWRGRGSLLYAVANTGGQPQP